MSLAILVSIVVTTDSRLVGSLYFRLEDQQPDSEGSFEVLLDTDR